jgi:hypothetical protein
LNVELLGFDADPGKLAVDLENARLRDIESVIHAAQHRLKVLREQ